MWLVRRRMLGSGEVVGVGTCLFFFLFVVVLVYFEIWIVLKVNFLDLYI